MLKIVVFDGGFGGEIFADELKECLDVVEIIRVIDWRNAEPLLMNRREARSIAEKDLAPYLGKVDLIVFANYLLSLTSLKYFTRKYPNQKFVGLSLKSPDTFISYPTLILTTTSVSKTLAFRNFVRSLKRRTKILTLDSWPAKIDDGELTDTEIAETIKVFLHKENFAPDEIILAEANFVDIKPVLKKLFKKMRIYDSFEDTLRLTCKTLKLRGGFGKKH